jgi:hypothetical protein
MYPTPHIDNTTSFIIVNAKIDVIKMTWDNFWAQDFLIHTWPDKLLGSFMVNYGPINCLAWQGWEDGL